MSDNSDKVKSLYYFLGNNQSLAKKNAILFGLDNYALNIDSEELSKIKYEIEKRSKNGDITLDDFRACWEEIEGKNQQIENRDICQKLFNLLIEISAINREPVNTSKIDNVNKDSDVLCNSLKQVHIANVIDVLDIDIRVFLKEIITDDDFFENFGIEDDNKEHSKYKDMRDEIKKTDHSKLDFKRKEYINLAAHYLIYSIDDNDNNELSFKEFEVILEEFKREKNL